MIGRGRLGRRPEQLVGTAGVPVQLAWAAPDLLYGVTVTGAVMVSTDASASWQQRGSLDGEPQALVADGKQRVYAATDSGIYASTKGGHTFSLRYRG